MTNEEFEPLIAVDEYGVLYMSVGLLEGEKEDEANMVDHPMFFCPFCGTELQTPEEVDAEAKARWGGRMRSSLMAGTFKFELVTPERMVDVAGRKPGHRAWHRGGVHRAARARACHLRPSSRRDRGHAGRSRKVRVFVKGGFAEVDADHVTVLARARARHDRADGRAAVVAAELEDCAEARTGLGQRRHRQAGGGRLGRREAQGIAA